MKYPKYISHKNTPGRIFWWEESPSVTGYYFVGYSNKKHYWKDRTYSPLCAIYTIQDAINANLELINQYNALKEFLKDTARDIEFNKLINSII